MGFRIKNSVLESYTEEPDVTEAVIPDGVTRIGEEAFEGCTGLTSVIIPDSVTDIGEYAFYRCLSLTSLVIPDSVMSIGNKAFWQCESLTSVILPDSVTSIADNAFFGCPKLKKLPAFGYVIDGSQWNWDEVSVEDVATMLKNKDYSVPMDAPTKYQFIVQVFLKDSQPEAGACIRQNITKILPYFIGLDDYDTIKCLLTSGQFVTKQHILPFIGCAAEHTRSGGDRRIQVLLLNYQKDNFPDMV